MLLAGNNGLRPGIIRRMGPDPESEPDYRMSLAAERTYLAYIRTSLALVAGGVAVVGVLPDAGQLGLRRAMGAVLVLAGLLVAGMARPRWSAVDKAMRTGAPLPRSRVGGPVAVALVVTGGIALALVFLL